MIFRRKKTRPNGPIGQSKSSDSRRRRRVTRSRRPRVEVLEDRRLLAVIAEFIDPNPSPGNQFGDTVLPLSTGNVVITSPFDDAGGTDAGAVYLFNGATGALISTLIGSSPNDAIGNSETVALSNGNGDVPFVVKTLDGLSVENVGDWV